MLRKHGDAIGALALVTVDNPMCPGTGHRICNDCMKACIYQKQEPVNIPQIETGVLTDVLRLPWGVEIYGLLTRWNPLNVRRPYPLPYNGKNVLVVGPRPGRLHARALPGERGLRRRRHRRPEDRAAARRRSPARTRRRREPVRDWNAIYRPLDERVLEGFGGVSEYGITVRWDKNFLTLLHLTLARRRQLRMYGGVRFGGTLPIEDAWALRLRSRRDRRRRGQADDHRHEEQPDPRHPEGERLPDGAAAHRRVQARRAARTCRSRLPAVVIGGGLTAIDTATELMAYYPLQVEKMLERYEALCAAMGEAAVRGVYDAEEIGLLDEFLAHGRAVRARARSAPPRPASAPNFVPLVRALGRRLARLPQAHGRLARLPAEPRGDHQGARRRHRLRREPEPGGGGSGRVRPRVGRPVPRADHRERPVARAASRRSRCRRARCSSRPARRRTSRTRRERPGTFQLDEKRKFFQPHAIARGGDGAWHLVPAREGFFTSYSRDGRFVTYYGDNHPRYAGNVVKAMASAKDGYPQIVEAVRRRLAALDRRAAVASAGDVDGVSRPASTTDFLARVEHVVRLTPTIVEVIVQGARGRAALPARPVLPAAELRDRCRRCSARTRRARAADGGHRADRRVGGQGAGAAVADRARAGRVEPARAPT